MSVVSKLTIPVLLGATVVVSGCEPTSLTEARRQLGRGPAQTLELAVPVALETIEPRELLPAGRDTIVDGLVAVKLGEETFAVPLAGLQVGDVVFEEFTAIDAAGVDFGDAEDAARASTLNAAQIGATVGNTANAPVTLANGTLGLVELDAAGNVPRDALGNPRYETDALGNPILVPIAAPGQTSLTVAANDSVTVIVPAGPLGDRLVHMVLDGRSTAAVAEGRVSLAGGLPTDVGLTDVLQFRVIPVIQLDFTIPDSGVVLTVNTLQDGLDLDTTDIDDLVSRLISAAVSARVVNQVPFGVELDLAYAPGDRGDLTDIFGLTDAVVLTRVSVTAPSVDALGRTVGALTDTVSVDLTGDDIRPLLGPQFTAGLRARLVPSAPGAARGAVGAQDLLEFLSNVRIEARTGGSP